MWPPFHRIKYKNQVIIENKSTLASNHLLSTNWRHGMKRENPFDHVQQLNKKWRTKLHISNTKNQEIKLTCNKTFKSSGPELQERKNWNTQKKNSSLLSENNVHWILLTHTSRNHSPPPGHFIIIAVVLHMKGNRLGRRRRRSGGRKVRV